jgi:hypothetical protein
MGFLLVALNWILKSRGNGHGAMMVPRDRFGNRKATRFHPVKLWISRGETLTWKLFLALCGLHRLEP